ncbi:MAG: DUF1566 domain-containing protein [Rikenellaceae bacterium]
MNKIITITSTLLLLSNITIAQELTYPIVGTNQTLFFDNANIIEAPQKGDVFYGQDANFQHNTPNYTDNGDGTITDNITGLVWQKDFKLLSYEEAIEEARKCTLGGKSDWRVPTIKEAYSLIIFSGTDASNRDMTKVPEGAIPFIDTDYFVFEYGSNGTRVIDTQMLSTTFNISSSERQKNIFGVNIADGRIKCYPMNTRDGGKKYTVRLVSGNAYGENQFVDNKDKTISDKATGLMWQKEDSGKGMNWEEALKYAEKMNKQNYLGYNDWRVPNIKELQSIVDYSRSPEITSSPAIDPVFETTKIKNEAGEADYPFFWSSTTHCSTSLRNMGSAAAYISFGRGLGNMQQGMGMAQSQGQQRQGQGQRQGMNGQNQGQGQRQGMNSQGQQRQGQNNSRSNNTSTPNWINIHGAGSQRSDPKSGDASSYTGGRGPQGDAIRIDNFVRLVRYEK